jgi:protein glucosyltransferase
VDAAYVKNQAFKRPVDLLYAEEANLVSLEDHCNLLTPSALPHVLVARALPAVWWPSAGRYRYLFNFRGVAASFRHKHLFLCRSLVFQVGEDWREFYYDALVPWVHYVPVSVDLRDARRLLTFFQQHGDLAEAIAENGRRFVEVVNGVLWLAEACRGLPRRAPHGGPWTVQEHLSLDAVRDYWRELLLAYAPLLRYRPRLSPGFRRLVGAGSTHHHDGTDL